MKKKFVSKDYKEELVNIAEIKKFDQNAGNLLLSMAYKIDDSYSNYQKVKREVPSKNEFFDEIARTVYNNCDTITILNPKGQKIASTNKKNDKRSRAIISLPNEKKLLYEIFKMSMLNIDESSSTIELALLTAINIGKCIAKTEVIRDFNGWAWSIDEKEIESAECNIIYTFLLFLLGHQEMQNITLEKIEQSVTPAMFNELKKVSMKFFMSYNKKQNDEILKKLSEYKKKLEKMKNQVAYVEEITERKKRELRKIKKIDEVLSNPRILKQEYIKYNNKLSNENKIFSVSHYEEKLQNYRQSIIKNIEEYNKLQNPNEYLKIREKLEYEVKFYEEKTQITKLQNEFLKSFSEKIDKTNEKKKILDLVYETRYLNFMPSCKLKLNNIEEKLIPKAIKHGVIAPISNNNTLDYRILKGIFNCQAVSMENLQIKLSSQENRIYVEIYDGEALENKYSVILPEGSNIEIRKSRKMRIFE